MKSLPEDTAVLRSSLSPAELSARLDKSTVAARFRFLPDFSRAFGLGLAAYRGQVGMSGFKITPDVSSFNITRPYIEGRYKTSDHGTIISLSQRMTRLGELLLLLRMSIVGVFALAFWWAAAFGSEIEIWRRLAYFIGPVAFYRFCVWFELQPFRAGAQRAKKDLVERFEATEFSTSAKDPETP